FSLSRSASREEMPRLQHEFGHFEEEERRCRIDSLPRRRGLRFMRGYDFCRICDKLLPRRPGYRVENPPNKGTFMKLRTAGWTKLCRICDKVWSEKGGTPA